MKQHLLRVTGLAILALFIQASGFAQQDSNQDRDDDSPQKYDEIIIRHKSGKDAKLSIEIKDGDVLVNGKPVSEYKDSSLSIHRRKSMRYGNSFSFTSPEIAPSAGIHVFPPEGEEGGWSYGGDNLIRSNKAMLGVVTEKKENPDGVKITQIITKGCAAEKMGLKVGDIITRVDDEEITDPRTLSTVIGGHEAGDKVTVTFMRDGKEQKQTGELGKGKAITMEPLNVYKFGMPEMKDFPQADWPKGFGEVFGNNLKFGIRAQDAEDGKGVKVLEVDDESTAAKAGIKEGDIITRFDGKDINSVTELTDAARSAKEKISVRATIVRAGKPQEVEVKVPKRLRTADL
jgi:serine protease Do